MRQLKLTVKKDEILRKKKFQAKGKKLVYINSKTSVYVDADATDEEVEAIKVKYQK